MLEQEEKYIEQAKNGNQEAFGSLYDHYLPKIYRFLILKLNNRAEAEDLTHEVFLSAWKNLPSYQHKGFPFSSWLYQIAKNALIDLYRTSKKTVPVQMVDEEIFEVPSLEPEKLNLSLELEKVRESIQLLRQDYQDLIIMRFVEELSHEEIANALDKSEGAVRLMQHRAIKELKEIYNNKQNGTSTHEA